MSDPQPIHCPHCGPGNSMVEAYQDDFGYWKVGCGACGSHSGTLHPNHKPDARRLVIESWNRRPELDHLRQALSEAEEREKDATENSSAFSQDQMLVIDRLDAALCNFLNGVGDEVDPRLWIPETKRNLDELATAYNQCHVVKVMDTLSSIKRRRDAALKDEVR